MASLKMQPPPPYNPRNTRLLVDPHSDSHPTHSSWTSPCHVHARDFKEISNLGQCVIENDELCSWTVCTDHTNAREIKHLISATSRWLTPWGWTRPRHTGPRDEDDHVTDSSEVNRIRHRQPWSKQNTSHKALNTCWLYTWRLCTRCPGSVEIWLCVKGARWSLTDDVTSYLIISPLCSAA